jgi:superfamily I DNA and/or RNA helicase
MLEPDIIEKYRDLHPDFDEQLLQQSLFERLFDLFKKAEQRGGPTRAVMLTDDFRMHPSISRLVSDLFYGGDVNPRCTVETRAHGLSCYGPGPFCWVDVPIQHGAEDGVQSKRRASEAHVLMEELERILSADQNATVGVITFYERQAALLADLCTRLPGSWQDRIRTGTVDAFQGREFDIVLLSSVRSNKESSIRRRVGFLAYPNRLCVAFSRARKLLVTIGDSETVAGSSEHPVITEFHALLAACKGEEGTYVRR